MVFEKLYVNEAGFSPVIMVDDLVKIHPAYSTKTDQPGIDQMLVILEKRLDLH